MKFKLNKYIPIIITVIFLLSLSLKPILEKINVNITGVDYIIWILYFLLLFTGFLTKAELKLPIKYFISLSMVFVLSFINSFTSEYTSFNGVLIGFFITLIFPLTFLVNYNIVLNEERIVKIVKSIVFVISTVLLVFFFEKINANRNFIRVDSLLIKTGGFAGTLCSLNIVFLLFLYNKTRKRRYFLMIGYTVFILISLVLLKSIVASVVTFTLYFFFFEKRNFAYKFVIVSILGIGAVFFLARNEKVNSKVELYKKLYLNTSGDNLTPRLLLYRESLNIAKDHFPLGSGQGTYGSFPVRKYYNQIYYDYKLNDKQGLMFNESPSFLFDSHWASVFGEMGFLATFFYIYLFLFPALSVFKYLKRYDYKKMVFLVVAVITVILIESFALAIPYQISFIIIYAGLSGLVCRFLKETHLK
ncbi:MAG: hypothetical protein GQ564_03410 [Bacteroidales bacterium]|nr:hypothetical protein [Bacteroidales bacterium]